MKIKTYFDKELITTLVFSVIGIIAGYASFLLNNSIMSFVLMISVAIVFYLVFKFATKMKEDAKWWTSNAIVIYVFLWIVSWTLFYNVWLR